MMLVGLLVGYVLVGASVAVGMLDYNRRHTIEQWPPRQIVGIALGWLPSAIWLLFYAIAAGGLESKR